MKGERAAIFAGGVCIVALLAVAILSLTACEPVERPPPVVAVYAAGHREIIRIEPDGTLYWHEREVTMDEEFRKAMLEAINAMELRKHCGIEI